MNTAGKVAAVAESRCVYLSGLRPYRIVQIRGRQPWRLVDSFGQTLLFSHYSVRLVLSAAPEGRLVIARRSTSPVPEFVVLPSLTTVEE